MKRLGEWLSALGWKIRLRIARRRTLRPIALARLAEPLRPRVPFAGWFAPDAES